VADVVVRVCPLGLDAEAFRPLWEAAVEYHGLLDGPEPPPLPVWEHERAWLRRALRGGDRGFVAVADDGDELVGYARVVLRSGGLGIWPRAAVVGELTTLSVAAPLRGGGVGGRLVEAVDRELAVRDVCVMFVSFWPQNAAARRFYERHGFRADAGGRHRRLVASGR